MATLPNNYIYTLTETHAMIQHALNVCPPPSCTRASNGSGDGTIIAPLNGMEWMKAEANDVDPNGDSNCLQANVELWRLIVSSLTKRHKVPEYDKVALVSEMNVIALLLESREEFFRRAEFTDPEGKDVKEAVRKMCRIYVPLSYTQEGDNGRRRFRFIRWAIV